MNLNQSWSILAGVAGVVLGLVALRWWASGNHVTTSLARAYFELSSSSLSLDLAIRRQHQAVLLRFGIVLVLLALPLGWIATQLDYPVSILAPGARSRFGAIISLVLGSAASLVIGVGCLLRSLGSH